eukprot:gene8630-1041_t
MQGVDLPVEIQAVLAILTAYSIQRLIFFIYSLDLFTSKERKRMEALQNEILAWKAQLLRISAMDELAKYCKIERKILKAEQEIQRLNPEVSNGFSSQLFGMFKTKAVTIFARRGTQALLFFITAYSFSGEQFYIPDALPNPLKLLIGPGPVSSAIWFPLCFAAGRALKL